jgi:hypothetical protein
MDRKTLSSKEAEEKAKAEARMARLLAAIFGGLIVAMIAGMLVFDAYGEKMAGIMSAPADSADH